VNKNRVMKVVVKICCAHGRMKTDEEFEQICERTIEELASHGWKDSAPISVTLAIEKLKISSPRNLNFVVIEHARTVDHNEMEFLDALIKSILKLDHKRQFLRRPRGSQKELAHHDEAVVHHCGKH